MFDSKEKFPRSNKIVISVGQAMLLSIEKLRDSIQKDLRKLPRTSLNNPDKEFIKQLEDSPLFTKSSKEQKDKFADEDCQNHLAELRKNVKKLDELKSLYLCGVTSESSKQSINKLIAEYETDHYHVSTDFNITSSEPSRRYFETHLALATLEHNVNKIDFLDDLKNIYSTIYKHLQPKSQNWLNTVATPEGPKERFSIDDNEEIDLFKKISTFEYDREKKFSNPLQLAVLEFITKIAIAATSLTMEDHLSILLPLAVTYEEGYFIPFKRGRSEKEDQEEVRSHNTGILKSSMPLPLDDSARASTAFSYLKPVDRDQFHLGADWVKTTAASLIHPFSCSISGHILGIARVFIWLKDKNLFPLDNDDKVKKFFQCHTSLTLAHGGGHSFHEFFAVFNIKRIKQRLNFSENLDLTDVAAILLRDNETAFDQALNNTLIYHKTLLNRAKLHQNILTALPQQVPAVSIAPGRIKESNTQQQKVNLEEHKPLTSGTQTANIPENRLATVHRRIKESDALQQKVNLEEHKFLVSDTQTANIDANFIEIPVILDRDKKLEFRGHKKLDIVLDKKHKETPYNEARLRESETRIVARGDRYNFDTLKSTRNGFNPRITNIADHKDYPAEQEQSLILNLAKHREDSPISGFISTSISAQVVRSHSDTVTVYLLKAVNPIPPHAYQSKEDPAINTELEFSMPGGFELADIMGYRDVRGKVLENRRFPYEGTSIFIRKSFVDAYPLEAVKLMDFLLDDNETCNLPAYVAEKIAVLQRDNPSSEVVPTGERKKKITNAESPAATTPPTANMTYADKCISMGFLKTPISSGQSAESNTTKNDSRSSLGIGQI